MGNYDGMIIGVPSVITKDMSKILDFYTKLSESTCIMCGKQGTIDYNESWLSPLCERHRKELNRK